MNQNLVLQELDIVIAARNFKPGILTSDFLKYAAIVPGAWELAQPPIHSNNFSQIEFLNGIRIIAQDNRIMLLESIEGKETGDIAVPYIAQNLIQSLPNIEYEAIGINPRGYVPFNQQQDAARQYLIEKLLAPGAWHNVGNSPMRANLNLVYNLDRSPFYLTVSEAVLRFHDETTLPVVMFGGGFSYIVTGNTIQERLNFFGQTINNWQSDLLTFQEIISSKFLTQVSESLPDKQDLFAMAAV